MTDWSGALLIELGGLALSAFVAAVTASWVLGRTTGALPSKADLMTLNAEIDDCRHDLGSEIKSFYSKIDDCKRECGETIAAIRSHVTQFELWARDNLVTGTDHDRLRDNVKEIFRKLDQFSAYVVKVDTMWAFQMRRAMSEVVERGVGEMKSPISFRPEARAALSPIKDDLVRFYAAMPPGTSDGEALLEIERQFGEQLLEMVCLPFQLTHGACLLLAYAVAKQADELEVRLQ